MRVRTLVFLSVLLRGMQCVSVVKRVFTRGSGAAATKNVLCARVEGRLQARSNLLL